MDFTVNVCESSDSVALLCCITFVVDGSECSAKLCSSYSALLVNLLFAFFEIPLVLSYTDSWFEYSPPSCLRSRLRSAMRR